MRRSVWGTYPAWRMAHGVKSLTPCALRASLCALLLLSACFFAGTAAAEDLALINRPVNMSGLTGLLFTTAPYTRTPGTVEIAASVLYENSQVPEYRMTEYPLSVTFGTTRGELALRSSFFSIKEGPTGTAPTVQKSGDLEVAYKWNFLPRPESSIMPSWSLIIAGLVPTDSNTDRTINTVDHWGARMGLSAGTELSWRDHVLGIYADGQVQVQDLTEKRIRDVYEIVNAGLLLPISKYRNLQMFFEYTIVHGRERSTLDGGDYSAPTYGLRLVSEQFNLTIGTQSLHKRAAGYDSSGRVVGLMSMRF